MSRYFVGVGAQKAGTTWLHDQLELHPQVAVPRRKELHYFDTVAPARSGESFGPRHISSVRRSVEQGKWGLAEKTLEVLEVAFSGHRAYLDYLERQADEESVVVGEITPAYATLDARGFAMVRRVLQHPKVIFVMRDPVARYWSSLRMSSADSEDAVERFLTNSVDEFGTHERDDYAATVRLLDRVFGDDVLYLFYENLFGAESLHRVADHLGVAREWDWDIGRHSNVGVAIDRPATPDVVADRLAQQYRFVRRRFGDEVPESWAALG